MNINTTLYEAETVCLRAIDFDHDPEIESAWTNDSGFLHAASQKIAMPLSPAVVKKQYENLEGKLDKERKSFYFTIRSKPAERLLGFAQFYDTEWAHGSASMQIAIGSPADRRQGFGSQAMRLLLQFAFDEANFHRLSAVIGADNPEALRFFQKFGFQQEVCRRKALQRAGKLYDLIHLGLLNAEWRSQ